jgi:hypothetical protein
MTELRARVINGRLVLDEPTDLPDGTVLDLVVDDEGDDLTDEERRARDAQIARGWRSVREGRGRDGQDVIDSLRRDR